MKTKKSNLAVNIDNLQSFRISTFMYNVHGIFSEVICGCLLLGPLNYTRWSKEKYMY